MMKRANEKRFEMGGRRLVASIAGCAGVVGFACATPAPYPAEVLAARGVVEAAQGDQAIAANAPARLERAKKIVRRAEIAFRKGAAPDDVIHLASIGAAQANIAREEAAERIARREYDALNRRVAGMSASLRVRDAENSALLHQLRGAAQAAPSSGAPLGSVTTTPPPPSFSAAAPTILVLPGSAAGKSTAEIRPTESVYATNATGTTNTTGATSNGSGLDSLLADLQQVARRAQEQEAELERRHQELERKAQALVEKRDNNLKLRGELQSESKLAEQRANELVQLNERIREARQFAEQQQSLRRAAEGRAAALEEASVRIAAERKAAPIAAPALSTEGSPAEAVSATSSASVPPVAVPVPVERSAVDQRQREVSSIATAEKEEKITELTEELKTTVALADKRNAALEAERSRVHALELDIARLSAERALLSEQAQRPDVARLAGSAQPAPAPTAYVASSGQTARLIELEGALEAARSEKRVAEAREQNSTDRARSLERALEKSDGRVRAPVEERSSFFRWPWSKKEPKPVRRLRPRPPQPAPVATPALSAEAAAKAAAGDPNMKPKTAALPLATTLERSVPEVDSPSVETIEAQRLASALRTERALLKEWRATLSPRGTVFSLEEAFGSNQTTLNAAAMEKLGRLAQLLNDRPSAAVEIEGHTDSAGAEGYNLSLSQNRASSVRDFLVSRGVSADRLRPLGFGEQRPIAPNNTASGRKRNRRVEIVLADAEASS